MLWTNILNVRTDRNQSRFISAALLQNLHCGRAIRDCRTVHCCRSVHQSPMPKQSTYVRLWYKNNQYLKLCTITIFHCLSWIQNFMTPPLELKTNRQRFLDKDGLENRACSLWTFPTNNFRLINSHDWEHKIFCVYKSLWQWNKFKFGTVRGFQMHL